MAALQRLARVRLPGPFGRPLAVKDALWPRTTQESLRWADQETPRPHPAQPQLSPREETELLVLEGIARLPPADLAQTVNDLNGAVEWAKREWDQRPQPPRPVVSWLRKTQMSALDALSLTPHADRAQQAQNIENFKTMLGMAIPGGDDAAPDIPGDAQLGVEPLDHPPHDPQQGTSGTLRDDGQSGSSWTSEEHGKKLFLSPEANAAADKALERAKAAEPHITAEMRPLLTAVKHVDPDAQLIGPEKGTVRKSTFSLKRKLAKYLMNHPGASPDKAFTETILDLVRYTIEVPTGHYVSGVLEAFGQLEARGFKLVTGRNYWEINQGLDKYKSINSKWRDPGSGQVFEIQFHTPQSLDAKIREDQYYHQLRQLRLQQGAAARSEEAMLEKLSADLFRDVPEPPGIDRLSGLFPGGGRLWR